MDRVPDFGQARDHHFSYLLKVGVTEDFFFLPQKNPSAICPGFQTPATFVFRSRYASHHISRFLLNVGFSKHLYFCYLSIIHKNVRILIKFYPKSQQIRDEITNLIEEKIVNA